MALVTDIDHLSAATGMPPRPPSCRWSSPRSCRFSIARLERVADKNRALRTSDPSLDQADGLAAAFARRMELQSRAIYFAVLSALLTAALLIGAFFAALIGIGHARIVAMMFVVALALLMASCVELAREMRVYMAHMHIE